jgi:hypothetical protein
MFEFGVIRFVWVPDCHWHNDGAGSVCSILCAMARYVVTAAGVYDVVLCTCWPVMLPTVFIVSVLSCWEGVQCSSHIESWCWPLLQSGWTSVAQLGVCGGGFCCITTCWSMVGSRPVDLARFSQTSPFRQNPNSSCIQACTKPGHVTFSYHIDHMFACVLIKIYFYFQVAYCIVLILNNSFHNPNLSLLSITILILAPKPL